MFQEALLWRETLLLLPSQHVTRKAAAIVVAIVGVLKSHQATVSLPLSSAFVSPKGDTWDSVEAVLGDGGTRSG